MNQNQNKNIEHLSDLSLTQSASDARGRVFKKTLDSIRLAQFDLGGVLYHANYFHLYEELREDFLRSLGLPYSELVAKGYHLAISESEQKFLAPVSYGEVLQAELCLLEISKFSLSFSYSLFKNTRLIHSAKTRHILVKASSSGGFKPARFPVDMQKVFNADSE